MHKRWTLGRRQALNANGQGRLQALALRGGEASLLPGLPGWVGPIIHPDVLGAGADSLGTGSPSGYSLPR